MVVQLCGRGNSTFAADVRLDLTMQNARLDLAIAAKGGSFILCHSKYLEWKLIYVGSAEDETYDQLLESVLVGPVNIGNYRFVLQADPPDPSKIREEDIIGVTVLLLTCSYLNQEFVRVGYYVNNDYDDEQLREEPPQKVLIDKVQRNILSDKPRVTKFPINFHPENNESSEQTPPPDHVTGAEGNEEELPCLTENHKNDGEGH
nr:probable histone chaperone ASF1A [Ipomoea batatas]